jgi:Fe-S-cluster-containing dehydrogenase component
MENSVSVGHFRAKVDFADTGEFPNAKRHFFPKLCNNCDDPLCVKPCPVKSPRNGATYKRKEDGLW